MARCASCNQNIHYGRYLWSGLVVNFFRNSRLFANKFTPIVTCGHCGQDNVQQPLFIIFWFLLIVALVFGLVVLLPPAEGTKNSGELRYYFIGAYLVVDVLWWTFVARLKAL